MKKTCLFIVILLILPFSVFSEDKATHLTLGYIEFAPYTFTNNAGKPEGILIDLAAKVFPDAGYTWDAVSYPVKRLVGYLVSGELDIWMGLKTIPEFSGNTYIGNEIVASLELNAYTASEKPPVQKKEDLAGRSVIILRGYSYGGWASYITDPQNNVHYIKTNKHVAGLKMLKAGRADYLLDYKEPVERALKKFTLSGLRHNQVSSLPCYFIVSQKKKNGSEIIKRLEKVVSEKKKKNLL